MNQTKIRAIITGATGMVGEGVMHECLLHPDVESVLIINRKASGYSHPKLREIVHADLSDINSIAGELSGYNACFFCLGVSSVGMKADEYYRITYTLTLGFAETLSRVCPDLSFCYVSGAHTDSSEKGRSRWARVKGHTENDLQKLSFRNAYAFRPGFIRPTKGLTRTNSLYKYIVWIFPIGRTLFPGGFCTLQELGLAMIRVVREDYPGKILEGKDIIALGK